MPKIEIEFTGTECFVVFDGTRIAKRGKNRTWISLEPGFVVSGDDDRLSRIRPAGQRMGNQNSYRRRDPEPRSVGQLWNLCLVIEHNGLRVH